MIELLRVPLENKPGQLFGAVSTVSKAGVDMKALSLTNQNPETGEVLLLVTNLPKAKEALDKARLRFTTVEAVVVEVPDSAGGLAQVLEATAKAGLSIREMFTFVTRVAGKALAVATFDDNAEAETLLRKAGVRTVERKIIEGEEEPAEASPLLDDYLGGSFFW